MQGLMPGYRFEAAARCRSVAAAAAAAAELRSSCLRVQAATRMQGRGHVDRLVAVICGGGVAAAAAVVCSED